MAQLGRPRSTPGPGRATLGLVVDELIHKTGPGTTTAWARRVGMVPDVLNRLMRPAVYTNKNVHPTTIAAVETAMVGTENVFLSIDANDFDTARAVLRDTIPPVNAATRKHIEEVLAEAERSSPS